MVGLVVYTSIPAVHSTPVVNEQNVWVQDGFPVQANTRVEQPRNITASPGMNNELHLNVTVSKPGAGSTSIHFQLLAMNGTQFCSSSPHTPTILIDQTISNKSFNLPLNATGTYCFVFDNQGPQPLKIINISARALGTAQKILITRDGAANTAGLGLGALGLAVALYGYSRKTVIPWE